MDIRRLREDDRRRMETAFAAAFDRSRAEAALVNPRKTVEGGFELLGEGACFEAWRLTRGPGGRRTTKGAPGAGATMSLVLKRAKPEWGRPADPQVRRWLEALRRLKTAATPLVPPIEVFQVDGKGGPELGLVMPYGDEPLSSAEEHWQPVDDLLTELDRQLQALGLVLGDVPQGRCWDGVPFVFDFSDLAQR